MLSHSVVFVKKDKSMKPPPLTFSWEIYNFLKEQEQPPKVFCKKDL